MNVVTTAVAAVAALVLGTVLGILISGETEPGDTSPEAGFARDMSVHHAQAVELAFLVRDRSDDEAIRTMTYDIINTQRSQIGMFSGWLQQWELPQTSTAAPMAWTDAPHGMDGMGSMEVDSYDDMPGMASDADVERLEAARGVEAEVVFLELMIEHHTGGVEMAEAVLPLTDRSEVDFLAQTIADGQRSEITVMEEMLSDRT